MTKTISTIAGLCAASAVMAMSAPARADAVLLDLIDAGKQFNTPYDLGFTATGASTTITIEGYQVPDFESSYDNGVFLNGVGANLLAQTWTYTPAPSGAIASQGPDPFTLLVNSLTFAGQTAGSYDAFSQTFATTAGDFYNLHLLYSNGFGVTNSDNPPTPSGFRVLTSGDAGGSPQPGVPEPATWAMMLMGFGALGAVLRRGRRLAAGGLQTA